MTIRVGGTVNRCRHGVAISVEVCEACLVPAEAQSPRRTAWVRRRIEHVSAGVVVIEHPPEVNVTWREARQGTVLYVRVTPNKAKKTLAKSPIDKLSRGVG